MLQENFAEGRRLLLQPVLPLVSMVRFFFTTGPFETVRSVIDELPAPIETEYARYEDPQALLNHYLPELSLLEQLKQGQVTPPTMVTEQGEPVEPAEAWQMWILQKILTRELERINSVLCAPCNCILCCRGPEHPMQQDFFEIPLAADETGRFAIPHHDNEHTRSHTSAQEPCLLLDGQPFYQTETPALIHWHSGWSLILPKESFCPHLAGESGRCTIYAERPQVCRRPQIFPYIVEPLAAAENEERIYRIRNAILAITDCPYVASLQEEIAAYAAACELEPFFAQNKQ